MSDFSVAPTVSNATAIDLAAAASSSALAHGGGATTEVAVVCNAAFNIRFGASDVAAPADTGCFPAGSYKFRVKKDTETHFRITANATLKGLWWRSNLL